MSAPTTARVLERALHLLETKGWCRRDYENDRGQHCAIGAIYALKARQREKRRADGYLTQVVGRSIIGWNDEQRSRTPVLAAFRKAIKLCRGEAT